MLLEWRLVRPRRRLQERRDAGAVELLLLLLLVLLLIGIRERRRRSITAHTVHLLVLLL